MPGARMTSDGAVTMARRMRGRRSGARCIGAHGLAVGVVRGLLVAAYLGAAVLLGAGLPPATAWAERVDATGEVYGADVEGTIQLSLDPAGGEVSGWIEMTVRFDCRGRERFELHRLDVTKGRVEGDRLVATAVYVERSGLPKDELSRCKSAYETYQTREDSRRLIGTLDVEGRRLSGTLGEYRPTVTWRAAWSDPPPPPEPASVPAAELDAPEGSADSARPGTSTATPPDGS